MSEAAKNPGDRHVWAWNLDACAWLCECGTQLADADLQPTGQQVERRHSQWQRINGFCLVSAARRRLRESLGMVAR